MKLNMMTPRFQLVVALSLAAYLAYYLTKVAKRPRFIGGKGPFRDFLLAHCSKFLEQRFWPTIWCIGPNVQSLVGLVLQASPD